MASKLISDLDSRMQPIVEELLARTFDIKINLIIITTLRTMPEQLEAIRHGISWTLNSKHLAQPPEGKSLAIDVCPYTLLTTKNWSPTHPVWWYVAKIGIDLGLKSGMDWHNQGLPGVGQLRPNWDPGHFEFQDILKL